jgi:hypothetical protein
MHTSSNLEAALQVWAGILLRCFLLGFGLLLFWLLVFTLGGTMAYTVHAAWFDLSRHEFDLVNYYGMSLMKLLIFLFFLFPYLSIKWHLRARRKE